MANTQAADGARGNEVKDFGAGAEHPSVDSANAAQASTSRRQQSIANASYKSPMRHHTRAESAPRKLVKETLNARSEYSNSGDDGTAEHRINQYLIKEEIGRGSFGAVHVAVDQYGQEYAVKEFSKSRLRKRAQSNLLRNSKQRPRPGHTVAGKGFNSPLHRRETTDSEDVNSLDLIKEEIAIMKKLNHPNVVSLIEVLDDPEEDSLYMVMEMCKKGVVMQVGLDQTADPYSEEQCRVWFRDMILGLEYLHTHGIVHRDIKPDNCLITDDDTLKFVDFGVSEMFEKDSGMNTAKSAGSPAFMPPELCVVKHGEVSGRACDIWSTGVTLYCLRYGRIPFEKTGVLDLFESIKADSFDLSPISDPAWQDLMARLLEKDPEKRIKIEELRVHPWVTREGTDPLLPKDENIRAIVEPPTEEELNHAITGNMGRLIVVMQAAKRFKALLAKRKPEVLESIFGSRFVQPPHSIHPLSRSKTDDSDKKNRTNQALAAQGLQQEIDPAHMPEVAAAMANLHTSDSETSTPTALSPAGKETTKDPLERSSGKGHAHDPREDSLYIGIGTGSEQLAESDSFAAMSESPGAIDFNVYEKAYQEEVDRLLTRDGQTDQQPTLFLTRRVEHIKKLRENEHIINHVWSRMPSNSTFMRLVEQAKGNADTNSTAKPSSQDAASSTSKVIKQARATIAATKDNATTLQKQDDVVPSAAKSGFSFRKLMGQAKQQIEAARPSKTTSSDKRQASQTGKS